MVTYNDLFTFVIMICAVISLVYSHKKNSVSTLTGNRRYFLASVTR